jgi:hypothetical protein
MQITQHKFERGTFVTYHAAGNAADRNIVVEGIIRSIHGDGSYTVEARHLLDDTGARKPGYLGFRYRIWETDLQARQ